MPIYAHVWVLFWILANNVYHTDLVFVTASVFISRFARARLQISTCSGCDLYHLGLPKIGVLHFDRCDLEKYVKLEVNLSVGAFI